MLPCWTPSSFKSRNIVPTSHVWIKQIMSGLLVGSIDKADDDDELAVVG
jgi:hypothetical protein